MALAHRLSLNIDTIRIHHWTECAAYCVKSPQQHRARGQLRWAILRRPVSIDPFRGPRGRITRFNEMTCQFDPIFCCLFFQDNCWHLPFD
jgi:hypothetical protein